MRHDSILAVHFLIPVKPTICHQTARTLIRHTPFPCLLRVHDANQGFLRTITRSMPELTE
ncbi:hypothetical protein AtEden1_Chr2g0229001 [Arabidopsis thaliana]